MKKAIKDMTVSELIRSCENGICVKCPLADIDIDEACPVQLFKHDYEEVLDKKMKVIPVPREKRKGNIIRGNL